MPQNLFKIHEKEYVLPGTRACQGCGLSIAYRFALKALREDTIVTLPACCLCVLHGLYPLTPVLVPTVNNTFASTAASASGIAAGLAALNRTETTVVAFAGDGGTFDMGLQALSGAAERGTDFIYVAYDNEGYMNTGTQRSSATPMGALTTTTPVLTKQQHKKDFLKIMEAHQIPYIATATPAYPIDLYDKFVRAKRIKGTRFIHIHTPCPPGWQYPTKDTIRIGRLAVDTGLCVLFEVENGKFRFTGRSKTLAEKGSKLPVVHYVERQGRFKKMSIEQLSQLQAWVDDRWEEYKQKAAESK
ncbi:MAG TPA: thiamine pyrophosphate-dependent enzyme [Syntrophales bacterium]|nr:thiamine pyrophosphate-dependent enzyme [Syntrophales bacterium]